MSHNFRLRKMVESGLVKRVKNVWRTSRPLCPEAHHSEPRPMSMQEFSPALFLLCIGVSISIVTQIGRAHV